MLKKYELGQYPSILTLRLVNTSYIEYTSSVSARYKCKCRKSLHKVSLHFSIFSKTSVKHLNLQLSQDVAAKL